MRGRRLGVAAAIHAAVVPKQRPHQRRGIANVDQAEQLRPVR